MSKGVLAVLASFLAVASPAPAPLTQVRLTPDEARSTSFDGSATGSSLVAGIRTKVLAGDPAASERYSILLFVPAHTTIAAHSHRDDRVASVVSGEWHIGYGRTFDEGSLKRLPPGSVYTEPAGAAHFAHTGDEAVIVQITGLGPTDTQYVDPANDPTKR